RDESQRWLDREVERAGLPLKRQELREHLQRELAQAQPLGDQPLLERGLLEREPLEEVALVEHGRLLERLASPVRRPLLEGVDVRGREGGIERDRLAHHAQWIRVPERLSEREQGLAKARP